MIVLLGSECRDGGLTLGSVWPGTECRDDGLALVCVWLRTECRDGSWHWCVFG